MSSLNDNLENAFRQKRVVFWYDPTGESKEEFDEVNLSGVEKVVMDYNAFAMKYRILRKESQQKFLLYFPYAKPEDHENWLLDIELSNFVFDTERSALFLQHMGLDYKYKTLVHDHIEFFGSKERRQQFIELFNASDSYKVLKYKMLSVVFLVENFDLQTLVQAYANSYFANLEKINKDLERFQLKEFFWKEVAEKYGYEKEIPNIFEFVIEVFENSFALSQKTKLSSDARLILSSWRDSITMRESYEKISKEIADILKIEDLLQDATIEDIVDDNSFELTDQKIIFELVHHLLNQDISNERFHKIIKTRESKFWYSSYTYLYKALENAYALFEWIGKKNTDFRDAEQAVSSYVKEEYRIDYHYRKFYECFYQAEKRNIIKHLIEKIENVYVNDWLFLGGNSYQNLLNEKEQWKFNDILMQRDFFKSKVQPILDKQKVVVVISDALRYECGVELSQKINRMNKFHAKLSSMVSALPSYTQLGMASLLPHEEINIDPLSDKVWLNGISSSGTENREKILLENTGKKAKALLAREFMHLKSAERRALIRDTEILYLYSNKIDKVGDDKMSENEVFSAAREEIENLISIVQAATSANASRILITADHGFIYQDSEVNEGDFVESKFKGNTTKENRRFVLGSQLIGDEASMQFKTEDLFIGSSGEVLIAKGINRFRVKGAGSRFVHGGASLQETVIPLLDIYKGREETVRQVEVDIIQSHNKITTNSLPIVFIQEDPVSEKILPVEIKAFIQAGDGKQLSDTFTFNFSFTSEEYRQRSEKFVFHMYPEAASSYRNQTVHLVMQVPIENTSRWKDYKRIAYTLNISFTNDFD